MRVFEEWVLFCLVFFFLVCMIFDCVMGLSVCWINEWKGNIVLFKGEKIVIDNWVLFEVRGRGEIY